MFSIPAGDDLSGVTSGEYPATGGESECVALAPKTDLKYVVQILCFKISEVVLDKVDISLESLSALTSSQI